MRKIGDPVPLPRWQLRALVAATIYPSVIEQYAGVEIAHEEAEKIIDEALKRSHEAGEMLHPTPGGEAYER